MTETEHASSTAPQSSPRPRRRWFRRVLMFGALPAVALSGLVATRAFAGGFGPGCRRHGAELTLDEAREHLRWMADYALRKVDATEQQKGQIHEILDRAAGELVGYRQEGRALKDDLREAILRPSVDAAELEHIRTDFVDSVDRASRVLVSNTQQIAAVLTPQQRAQLMEAWRDHHR